MLASGLRKMAKRKEHIFVCAEDPSTLIVMYIVVYLMSLWVRSLIYKEYDVAELRQFSIIECTFKGAKYRIIFSIEPTVYTCKPCIGAHLAFIQTSN